MRLNPEDALQRNCVTWFRYQYPQLKLIAVPNGGGRTKLQGTILKMTGVLAGVFDLFLIKPVGKYAGLWLEAKCKYDNGSKNYLSKEQKEFKAYVDANGYKSGVFYSLDEFKVIVKEYLSNEA